MHPKSKIPDWGPQFRRAELCLRSNGSDGQTQSWTGRGRTSPPCLRGARPAGLGVEARGQPCSGLRARARVRAANLGPISARRPAPAARPAPRAPAGGSNGRGGSGPSESRDEEGLSRGGSWNRRGGGDSGRKAPFPPSHRPRPSTGTPNFHVPPPGVLSEARLPRRENAGHVRAGQVLPEVVPGAGRDGALHGPQSHKGG